jgi:hypothetical protein
MIVVDSDTHRHFSHIGILLVGNTILLYAVESSTLRVRCQRGCFSDSYSMFTAHPAHSEDSTSFWHRTFLQVDRCEMNTESVGDYLRGVLRQVSQRHSTVLDENNGQVGTEAIDARTRDTEGIPPPETATARARLTCDSKRLPGWPYGTTAVYVLVTAVRPYHCDAAADVNGAWPLERGGQSRFRGGRPRRDRNAQARRKGHVCPCRPYC